MRWGRGRLRRRGQAPLEAQGALELRGGGGEAPVPSPVPAHRCQSVSDFPARPERAAPIPGLQGKLRGSNLPGQQQNKTDDKIQP